MTITASIVTALSALVSNRVTPDMFPQENGAPTVPAIRYTLVPGGDNHADLAGDGDATTDDVRIQLDWIARTADARDALGLVIRAAMKTLDPPCVMDGTPISTYDAETKVFRGIGFWVSQGSSTT